MMYMAVSRASSHEEIRLDGDGAPIPSPCTSCDPFGSAEVGLLSVTTSAYNTKAKTNYRPEMLRIADTTSGHQ